jgi:hypothetical protein
MKLRESFFLFWQILFHPSGGMLASSCSQLFFYTSNWDIFKSVRRSKYTESILEKTHIARMRKKNKKIMITKHQRIVVVQKYIVLKNRVLISSNVLSRCSKILSFISLHRHHKRHECTIFHTTLWVMMAVHQQAYKLITCLDITQDSLKRLKKTFHKAQATSQWKRRWSIDSHPFYTYRTYRPQWHVAS